MADLGQAYVQIIPKAEGISGAITNVLEPEGRSAGALAGQAAGSSFGSKIVGTIAKLGIGALVVKGFKDAMSAGGELEQNLGGSYAVFGDYAEQMQSKAREAYRNMGLSASDYMATANKMGSLFQGSGIEQQRALELTTDAMQRAADVASVMGIDQQMAMESIAGAAKGNFNMMDNLGVAMTATTLQAYALEKGVNFDWKTATNAEKAELAMQMFMDRTSQYENNFARESEDTFTGSLGAMKASAENFAAYLATGEGNPGEALTQVLGTAATFVIKNFIPMVTRILTSLPGAISTVLTELGPEVGTQVSSFFTTALAEAPAKISELGTMLIDFLENIDWMGAIGKGLESLGNIATLFYDSFPSIMMALGDLLGQIGGYFAEHTGELMEKGGQLVKTLAQGIIRNLPDWLAAMANLAQNALAAIARMLPSFLQSGLTLIGQLLAGVLRAIPKIPSYIAKVIAKLKEVFQKVDWAEIGKNILEGIVKGVLAMVAIVAPAWEEFATYMSEKFTQIKERAAIIWENIKAAIMRPINAVKEWAVTVWTSIKTTISNLWDSIKEKASSIWESIKTAVMTPIDNLRELLSTAWDAIKTKASNMWDAIKSTASSVWEAIKTAVMTPINSLIELVSGVWDSIKTTATNAWDSIKSAITGPIDSAKTTISNILGTIKGFFPLSIGKIFSDLKLPHISVNGGKAPYGIGGKGKKPSFSVSWYAKAMENPYLFNKATLFGAGEVGDEILYGRKALMDDIKKASGGKNVQITNNITVNGAEDPERYADRFVRRLNMQMRMA